MPETQAKKLMEIAKEQVSKGIYAVRQDDYIELRNDTLEEDLLTQIEEWERHGFEVYANN